MTDKLSQKDRSKLLRNLVLSAQTVICCGHAMRVTVADMLQDFDKVRALAASDPQPCEKADKECSAPRCGLCGAARWLLSRNFREVAGPLETEFRRRGMPSRTRTQWFSNNQEGRFF